MNQRFEDFSNEYKRLCEEYMRLPNERQVCLAAEAMVKTVMSLAKTLPSGPAESNVEALELGTEASSMLLLMGRRLADQMLSPGGFVQISQVLRALMPSKNQAQILEFLLEGFVLANRDRIHDNMLERLVAAIPHMRINAELSCLVISGKQDEEVFQRLGERFENTLLNDETLRRVLVDIRDLDCDVAQGAYLLRTLEISAVSSGKECLFVGVPSAWRPHLNRDFVTKRLVTTKDFEHALMEASKFSLMPSETSGQ